MPNIKQPSRKEQVNNRLYAAVRLHQIKTEKQGNALIPVEDMKTVDEMAIRLLAYQIHLERGGIALDNWLEAERTLTNHDTAISGFLNEGNPNIEK